jgi:hypothetical protein
LNRVRLEIHQCGVIQEVIMAYYTNWLPGSRDDQFAMAKTWSVVLAARGADWGVPEADIAELNTLIAAADAALFHAKSSDRSPVVTAQCREAFEELVEKMRYIKARFFLTPPLTEADYAALLLKKHASGGTDIPIPDAQPTADLTFPGIHLVELRKIRPMEGTEPDPRSEYGVRICWGLGGETTEAEKFRVTGTPKSGKDLPHSLFTRRKKERFDFDGESGNRVYFCLRYENPSGGEGSFGPILTAVIP